QAHFRRRRTPAVAGGGQADLRTLCVTGRCPQGWLRTVTVKRRRPQVKLIGEKRSNPPDSNRAVRNVPAPRGRMPARCPPDGPPDRPVIRCPPECDASHLRRRGPLRAAERSGAAANVWGARLPLRPVP